MKRVVLALCVLVVLLAIVSLHLGINAYSPHEVWRALTTADQDATALIVRTLRLPRVTLAIVVGGALGVSGLLMQTVTRNPIAEPGLLGVNSGAAFAVVVFITVTGSASVAMMTAVSSVGALLAAALVFAVALSTATRFSPVHMLLAGITVAALLGAGTQVLVILNEAAMEELLFWLSGAFADRPLAGLRFALPVILAGLVVAMAGARMLDVLQTDETTAEALGIPVRAVRIGILASASLLAGVSVSLAGPVVFVGLIAPHFARLLGMRRHLDLIPVSALCGALLAVIADIAARYVIYPTEAPISAVMALAGVPALIMLLKQRRLRIA